MYVDVQKVSNRALKRLSFDYDYKIFRFTVSFTIFMAAFWTMYISPLLLKFERGQTPFHISTFEKGWIVSIMDFGNFLSAIPAGFAMDKAGRKTTLMFSAAIYLAASIFAIFATGGIHLFIARLLAGIGKGFSFTVAPIYVAEISSKNIRGALMSSFYAFFCAGVILAAGVGPYVSFDTYNYISLGMPILFICLMLPLPESMYYYVMINKLDRAEYALKWFRYTDTNHQIVRTFSLFFLVSTLVLIAKKLKYILISDPD
jgi:MFS family permease